MGDISIFFIQSPILSCIEVTRLSSTLFFYLTHLNKNYKHNVFAPTFPGIDSWLMVIKRDFLEMEASLWLNGKSQNVAKGWLST